MIRFGTDGVRGLAGEGAITSEVASRIGAAARRLGGPVFVARDTRPSGPELSAAVLGGAGDAGIDLGVAPTSALGSVVRAHPGSAGVMVTASHNAACDNGFKVLAPGGGKLDGEEIARFEAWLEEASPASPARSARSVDPTSLWLADLEAALPSPGALRGLRVVVDLASGAATRVFPALDELFPGVFEVLDGGPVINITGSEHPQRLQAAVLASNADFGIALDGDADRCLLVDAAGQVVPGDLLIFALAEAMRATEIAVTVMSSVALEAALPGVQVHRTPVGDRHLLAAQRAHGLPLAAEESGHVLLAEQRRDGRPYLAFPGSDGLLTALRAIVSAPGREAWSALAGRFTRLPRRLLKVPVQIRRPLESWDALARAEQDVSGWLGRPGRTFLRYSGTEPVLRILVEGSDADGVARAAEHLRAVAEAGA